MSTHLERLEDDVKAMIVAMTKQALESVVAVLNRQDLAVERSTVEIEALKTRVEGLESWQSTAEDTLSRLAIRVGNLESGLSALGVRVGELEAACMEASTDD